MKHSPTTFLKIALAAFASLATLPAWSAMSIDDTVDYIQDAKPDPAGCGWEASLAPAAVKASAGGLVRTPTPGPKLSLRVAKLEFVPRTRSSYYNVILRADVTENGKLLTTRDFAFETSNFKPQDGETPCASLGKAAATLGERAGAWAGGLRPMDCREGCKGMHPDEPIVMDTLVALAQPDAINDKIRDDCRFHQALVDRVVSTYNRRWPTPRAPLEARPVDIENWPGRKLVLRVHDVHALAGIWPLTGPKWMEVSGELREGDLLVGSFTYVSHAGSGVSTCRSMESMADDTAWKISEWLLGPSVGAALK